MNQVEYPNNYLEELIVDTKLSHRGASNSRQSLVTSDSDDQLEMIPSSIYPDTDVRCKKYPSHINPVIESELFEHKLAIEILYKRSTMNMNYKFERKAKNQKNKIAQ